MCTWWTVLVGCYYRLQREGKVDARAQLWPVFSTSGSCLVVKLGDGEQMNCCVRFQVFV